MAKISARGAKEVWRFSLTVNIEEIRESQPNRTARWEKLSVVEEQQDILLRSDGHILQRDVTTFKAGPYDSGKDRRHDYGWKDKGKFSPAFLSPSFLKTNSNPTIDDFKEYLKSKGFKETTR